MQDPTRHCTEVPLQSPLNVQLTANSLEVASNIYSNMPTIVEPSVSIEHLPNPTLDSHERTTTLSTPSSSSYESSTSATSMSSHSRQYSAKSNLEMQPSKMAKRRSSPPVVRFAEPEPTRKATSETLFQQVERRQQTLSRYGHLNPVLQQHRPVSYSVPSYSVPMMHSRRPQGYAARHLRGMSNPQISVTKARAPQRKSAPVQQMQPDLHWSVILPPRPVTGSRVTSFQSVSSNISVQSAPAALLGTNDCPPEQYNPLEHYVPCIYAGCRDHYTLAHAGPTYYLPQGTYSLPRLHGYCQRHAAREQKEANETCKREFESQRQNAGRKTLGQIAREFDLFLKDYREERQLEDAELQRKQKAIVLGASVASTKNKDTTWDWRYTPRACTKASCQNAHYSPFANHLFAFYMTQRPSQFLPRQTLCPSCANSEIEAFESTIQAKWASQSNWDGTEWKQWIEQFVKDQATGVDLAEKEQEHAVRAVGPVKRTTQGAAAEESVSRKAVIDKKTEKRKGFFKKLFIAN